MKKPILKCNDKTYFLYSPFEPQDQEDNISKFYQEYIQKPSYNIFMMQNFKPLIPELNFSLDQIKNHFIEGIVFRSFNAFKEKQISEKFFKNVLAFYHLDPQVLKTNNDIAKKLKEFEHHKIPFPRIKDLQSKYINEIVSKENTNIDYKYALFLPVEEKIKSRLINDYNFLLQKGFLPLILAVQGSQNYNLATPNSDIDTKAFVIPLNWTEDDISTTYTLENVKQNYGVESPEFIDVKSLSNFKKSFLKCNPSYYELLFSKSIICNTMLHDLLEVLLTNKYEILYLNKVNFLKGIIGFMDEKIHALNKPFASKVGLIERFGYDPKQLHHLYRLDYQFHLFKKNYFDNKNLINPYLIYDDEVFKNLIQLKENPAVYKPEEVQALRQQWKTKIDKYYQFLDKYVTENEAKVKADQNAVLNWFENKFQPEFLKKQNEIQAAYVACKKVNKKI